MNSKTSINDIRRANLRKLVLKYEGMNSLARQLGLARGAYISQLLMGDPHRLISEKTARSWERKLSLAEGWFDKPTANESNNPAQADTKLLSAVVRGVLDGMDANKVKLPNARVADLVALQYTDALQFGRFDPERLNTIFSILKA